MIKKIKSNPQLLSLSLLCAVVFSMTIIRIFYSLSLRNAFIYWNVFLALLAIVFAYWFRLVRISRNLTRFKNLSLVIIFFGWLSLMPNSIYLITDIGHLNGPRLVENSRYNPYKNKAREERSVPYIYDVALLFLLALIGFISSGISTNAMYKELKGTNLKNKFKFNKKTEILYLGLISFASGTAVFLGRYLRWNSWDLIINPINILKDLFYYFTHPLAEPNLYLSLILFFIMTALAHLFSRSKSNSF